MLPIFVLLSFIAGVVAAGPLLRMLPQNRKVQHFLISWDGQIVSSRRVKSVVEGVEESKIIYPAGILRSLEVAPNLHVHLIGVESVALADHKALEKARRTIALRALFRSGGEWLRWLQLGACLVPILVCLMLWSSFGSVQNSINQQAANVLAIKAILDKPLVTAPAPVQVQK